jgi:hypothetical protein
VIGQDKETHFDRSPTNDSALVRIGDQMLGNFMGKRSMIMSKHLVLLIGQ